MASVDFAPRAPLKSSGPFPTHPLDEADVGPRFCRAMSVCTSNCRYDVIRRMIERFGMKDVSEDECWDLYWTDQPIPLEGFKCLKGFQKINHFPAMVQIIHKDSLARNLIRMRRHFPRDYNFFPRTWCLPMDLKNLIDHARVFEDRTFILKPVAGHQGQGIYLTKSVHELSTVHMVCQVYIARPLLIDGLKFDMRIFTLITCCDPLRVYMYNEGLCRFATNSYREPDSLNATDIYMHLTNYTINKNSSKFVVGGESGSKRKITTLNKWLESRDVDVAGIWTGIDELIVKTLISALPVVQQTYRACFPDHDRSSACFSLLGFDVLLDEKLKPYLLEVNHSPSLHMDAQVDRDVKEPLAEDLFRILDLPGQDYDRRSKITADGSDFWQAQFKWEDDHMGNFRRLYPVPDGQPDKYLDFLDYSQATASSPGACEARR